MTQKKNVSLTLSEDVLEFVSDFRDESEFTNRSQTFEYILRSFFGENEASHEAIELLGQMDEMNIEKIRQLNKLIDKLDGELDFDENIKTNQTETEDESSEYMFENGTDERMIEELYLTFDQNEELVREEIQEQGFEKPNELLDKVIEAYE